MNPYKLLYDYSRWGLFLKEHPAPVIEKEKVRVESTIKALKAYIKQKYGTDVKYIHNDKEWYMAVYDADGNILEKSRLK